MQSLLDNIHFLKKSGHPVLECPPNNRTPSSVHKSICLTEMLFELVLFQLHIEQQCVINDMSSAKLDKIS